MDQALASSSEPDELRTMIGNATGASPTPAPSRK
jgi:hypothetical protein